MEVSDCDLAQVKYIETGHISSGIDCFAKRIIAPLA